ncbi:MAG TPA: hypothetical protein VH139_11135 [Acidobacteriaceae bacterium]|jgi:hypothetical protein|nr:hypothetical protein [Acidobacteriaceae bacterium]
MGLFDRLKKPPYNPDAPVNVPAEPVVPQSTIPEPAIPEPELPERHEQVQDEPAPALLTGTPGRRFVSVPEERFNLDDTNRLAQAMEVAREQRDSRWLDEFQSAAWNASIVLPTEPVFLGPDGMPYVRLALPPVGEAVETNCLSNLFVSMAEQGLGAAFFKNNTDPPEAAEYVMPTGVLESLRAYGTWDGDPDDVAELSARPQQHAAGSGPESGVEKTDVQTEREVMIGSPSENYLPKHTARLLHRHLTEGWKMEDPRIALVVDPQMTPTRNLVIGRKYSEFPDQEIAAQAARMLLWYLPPRRYLLLMPENWNAEQMRPLRELC